MGAGSRKNVDDNIGATSWCFWSLAEIDNTKGTVINEPSTRLQVESQIFQCDISLGTPEQQLLENHTPLPFRKKERKRPAKWILSTWNETEKTIKTDSVELEPNILTFHFDLFAEQCTPWAPGQNTDGISGFWLTSNLPKSILWTPTSSWCTVGSRLGSWTRNFLGLASFCTVQKCNPAEYFSDKSEQMVAKK